MKNDDQHLEGFNDGYIIKKYEPELANQMLANLDGVDEPYMQGFVAGVKEYARELFKERMKERDPTKDRDKDLGYDR